MLEKICLIGFMGCGKTTIGEALSKALESTWVDLDHWIELQEGCKISDIFASKGEDYFRTLEAQYLAQLVTSRETIIATGGGAVVTKINRELLKTQHTFYLHWEFDTLYHRIAGDTNRPLATSYESLKARYEERQSLYEEACTCKIACEGKSVEEITASIKYHLKLEID